MMAEPTPGWQTADGAPPPAAAFHVERVIDPFTRQPTIGMVRHAGHAFVQAVPAGLPSVGDAWPSPAWHRLGARYLQALASALKLQPGQGDWLPQAVWDALMAPLAAAPAAQAANLQWLPICWGHRADGSLDSSRAVGSFMVSRRLHKAVGDRSLVLLAGCADHGLLLGTDMGLRLTLHLRGGQVCIHGVTLAGLGGDRALHCRPDGTATAASLFTLVNKLRQPIGIALGQGKSPETGVVDYRGVWIKALEQVPEQAEHPNRLRVSGFLRRAPVPGGAQPQGAAQRHPAGQAAGGAPVVRARIHDFSVDVDVMPAHDVRVVAVHRNEFAGSAASTDRAVRAFLADGSSRAWPAERTDAPPMAPEAGLLWRRPTRDEDSLAWLRSDLRLRMDGHGALRFGDGSGSGTLDNPVGTLCETRGAHGDGSVLGARTMEVDAAAVVQIGPPVHPAAGTTPPSEVYWTDTQASVEAHVRACELFGRFAAYGIDPHAYFRFARLPLVQRARAALQWVPDGDMPAAEVRPFLGDAEQHLAQHASASSRPQLLVKYGSADPMVRRMVPLPAQPDSPAGKRTRAQYLGVASDPRWAWHEFGHVLNFASTGELEYPFAHSAGDALGAIASDPLSVLAPADDPESPLRFQSFPWIQVPGRAHGRRTQEGYCWCGRRNLLRLDFSAPLERHHHGYFEEQLLSSSLFRLYRSLGGDTGGQSAAPATGQAPTARTADEDIRLAAADWCIYLVMRAISLLGPDSIAPARSADQFVSALVDADLGTGLWEIDTDWPMERGSRAVRRQGGWSHKVIRWAFERQGLFATDDPRATADGPGQPPAVDVFIADRRPTGGPDAHPGGYAPVPLRPGVADAPWHADTRAVRLLAGDRLEVALRNRGGQAATGLQVRAWWSPAGKRLAWTPATTWGGPQHTLLPHDGAALPALLASPRPKGEPGAGWLLVAVDAAADQSNLPLRAEPPARHDDVLQLVAGDNNLALLHLPAR